MTSKALKASLISVVLLALVIWMAGLGRIDLSAVRPVLLIPALATYLAVLVLRAALLRLLSRRSDANRSDADTVAPAPYLRWLSLAARHQFVFTLAPSGAGDLAFPLLAGRHVGLDTLPAARLIADMRLRDIMAIIGLGGLGLVGSGHAPWPVLLGSALAGAALYWSDLAMSKLAALLHWLRPNRPNLSPAPIRIAPSALQRLSVAGLVLVIWLMASGGVASGFAAAGHPLSLFDAWIMLAGLNVAGALAMSVAGLGVAEAGATGVLVFLGMPLAEAAAVAIIARPLLLLSSSAACGVIEVTLRVLPRSAGLPQ